MWCFVVLVALTGSVSPVHATEEGRSALGRAWAWLAELFPSAAAIQGLWIDPNGGDSTTADQGLWIDPDG
ncbi:MAG TPA: hypothetical protein DD490_34920 [Acidobacteria bacterium]|nr:hypothetical protein [Acidobacteriota bacterium]